MKKNISITIGTAFVVLAGIVAALVILLNSIFYKNIIKSELLDYFYQKEMQDTSYFISNILGDSLALGNYAEVLKKCSDFAASKTLIGIKLIDEEKSVICNIGYEEANLENYTLKAIEINSVKNQIKSKLFLKFSNQSYMDSLRRIYKIVYLMGFSTLIIFIAILLFFKKNIYSYFTRQVLRSTSGLDNNPVEFNPIRSYIFEIDHLFSVLKISFDKMLKFEKEAKEREIQLSKQENYRSIIHDLRLPVFAIENFVSEKRMVNDFDRDLMIKRSCVRISSILDSYCELAGVKTRKSQSYKDVFATEIKDMLAEFKLLYPSIKLNVLYDDCANYEIALDSVVIRCLQNLINNSCEALGKSENCEIKLIVKLNNGLLKLSVTDNGEGVDLEVVKALNENPSSFNKPFGNGIGLRFVRSTIEGLGGNFLFTSIKSLGSCVSIDFPLEKIILEKLLINKPYFNLNGCTKNVLLEDDKYIRLIWERQASDYGIELLTYESSITLLANLPNFNKEDNFFIDLDLGNGKEEGMEILETLEQNGFKNIFLNTYNNVADSNMYSQYFNCKKNAPWIENLKNA